jgi:YbbR domain-containing protein
LKLLDRIMHRWHIKVFSFFLALVLFWFYRVSSLDERFFSVPLNLEMNPSYIPAGDYPSHVSITLRGTSEDIFSVLEEDISASADFSLHGIEGRFREPIVINKKGTALNNGEMEIRVEPGEVVILQEEKLTRTLPVDPTLSGFPSLGYDLSQYFVSPSSITVVGPRSEVEKLQSLSTEPIDLSGKYEDFTATSRLKYPSSLVFFPGGDVVEFKGVIEEALLVKTIANIDVTLLNFNSDLTMATAIPKGSVTIQGNQAQVEALDQGSILLFADCSGLDKPGEYSIPVRPQISGDTVLLNWLPREITITLTGE